MLFYPTLYKSNSNLIAPAEAADRAARDEARSSKIKQLHKMLQLPPSHEVSQPFNFVSAEAIIAWDGTSMPSYRELRSSHPDMVTRKTVTLSAVLSGELQQEYGVVSHRWVEQSMPDRDGTQLTALQGVLRSNPRLKWVWFDDWCMFQGERNAEEKEEFTSMLRQVNLLYLGLTVIILLDGSYMSRFWTQLEAWCSMQKLTSNGVVSSTRLESRRFLIACIYNAAEAANAYTDLLVDTWKGKTPEDAHDILASPDVSVTNQSDKDVHLPKVAALDKMVGEAFVALIARVTERQEAAVVEAEEKLAAEALRLLTSASKHGKSPQEVMQEYYPSNDAEGAGSIHGGALILLPRSQKADVLSFPTLRAARSDRSGGSSTNLVFVPLEAQSPTLGACGIVLRGGADEAPISAGPWSLFRLSVGARDDAIQLSFDGEFLTSDDGRVFDVDRWLMQPGIGLNLLKGRSEHETRMGEGQRGGRSFVLNADHTISPARAPHLALGVLPPGLAVQHFHSLAYGALSVATLRGKGQCPHWIWSAVAFGICIGGIATEPVSRRFDPSPCHYAAAAAANNTSAVYVYDCGSFRTCWADTSDASDIGQCRPAVWFYLLAALPALGLLLLVWLRLALRELSICNGLAVAGRRARRRKPLTERWKLDAQLYAAAVSQPPLRQQAQALLAAGASPDAFIDSSAHTHVILLGILLWLGYGLPFYYMPIPAFNGWYGEHQWLGSLLVLYFVICSFTGVYIINDEPGIPWSLKKYIWDGTKGTPIRQGRPLRVQREPWLSAYLAGGEASSASWLPSPPRTARGTPSSSTRHGLAA